MYTDFRHITNCPYVHLLSINVHSMCSICTHQCDQSICTLNVDQYTQIFHMYTDCRSMYNKLSICTLTQYIVAYVHLQCRSIHSIVPYVHNSVRSNTTNCPYVQLMSFHMYTQLSILHLLSINTCFPYVNCPYVH